MTVDDNQLLDYLKKVTIELQDTRARLEQVEQTAREPIAIIGIGCRYPGRVESAEQLWDLVASDGDAISKFPDDRGWNLVMAHDLVSDEAAGSGHVDEGGFLHDVGEFDAGFFGIGDREALTMDPQQRVLLEVSWEAIESAGIDPASLRDSQTGVFAGVATQDHGMRLMSESMPDDLGVDLSTGSNMSVLSGRIAYVMGFGGPAITIETACSSSLVALHLACDSLRRGECSLALAGGVTVMSTPLVFSVFGRQQALASDGRCKSFADSADGIGFSEGAGMVAIERLSDARRHGHEVLAVIRGSAVNQGGRSNGLTAPSGRALERVIRQALASASLDARQVDVVEAHGTGTMLGDPIEAEALLATYGRDRSAGRPLWLGTVKSNIGHSQAAGGVAGVIKMVMALRRESMPRTLHVRAPSGKVDWSLGDVSLLTQAVPWSPNGEPRRAGVSSFGVSGTNAHMILEEAPVLLDERAADSEDGKPADDESGTPHAGLLLDGAVPWIVSGTSRQAVRAQAARLRDWVLAKPDLRVRDVGLSLARTRSAFEHRAVVVGAQREQLTDGLGAVARGEAEAGIVEGRAGSYHGNVVFVFPGHGSQWAGMAGELLDSSPVFANSIRACEEALAPHLDWSLLDLLQQAPGAPSLDRFDVAQPALFALMIALAELWQACGVCPDAIVGHSTGEIAAAHVAGALSLEDAARLVAVRSRLLASPTGGVGMVSGDAEALSTLSGEPAAEKVRVSEVMGLEIDSHSPQADGLDEQLLRACTVTDPRTSDIPFYSTVTAGRLDTAGLDARYWYRNARDTVRFEQTMRGLLEDGSRTFVEMSPHPVLSIAMLDTIVEALENPEEASVVASLCRGEGGTRRFLTSLGEAWVHGVEVDWASVFAGNGATRVPLPTYAFQRKRYWFVRSADDAGRAVVKSGDSSQAVPAWLGGGGDDRARC